MGLVAKPPRESLIRLGLALIAGAAFLAAGLSEPDRVSREAVVYEGICDQLLAKTTVGRQALISSVWWPPLPAIVRLPLAAVLKSESLPVASLLAGAVFGAASLVLLERILVRRGTGWCRWVFIGALLASPRFREACVNGSPVSLNVFLCLLTARGFVDWVSLRQVRALAYMSMGAACLLWTTPAAALWLALLFGILLLDTARLEGARSRREAVLLMALFPPVYAAGLWVLFNWLIMGDGLYFARSLLSPAFRNQLLSGVSATSFVEDGVPAAWCALLLLASLGFRNRAGVGLSALALGQFVALGVLSAAGVTWELEASRTCLAALSVLATAYAVAGIPRPAAARGPEAPLLRREWGIAGIGVVAAAVVAWPWTDLMGWDRAMAGGGASDLDAVQEEQNMWLPRLERHVLETSPYVRVYVCGYDSLPLLAHYRGEHFLHSLDFNFNKAKDDYPGHTLYVLVRRPEARGAADSIHWKFKDFHPRGSRATLYDGDWGDWRLYERVQPPRRNRQEKGP